MQLDPVDVALECYQQGQEKTLQLAARRQYVAKSTVADRNKGWLPWSEAFTLLLKITKGEEDSLASYVGLQTLGGYPFTTPVLWQIVTILLQQRMVLFLNV
jgi:hypothetical protein